MMLAVVFVAGGIVGWLLSVQPTPAVVAQANADEKRDTPQAATEAADEGVRAITADYVKAFNAGDAKQAASLWTAEGEYINALGEEFRGRAAIEESLADLFKENPDAKVTVKVEAVESVSRGLAAAKGVVTLQLPGDQPASKSRYTALHVLEDGKWRAASVSEWFPDPATDLTLEDLKWLVGEWTAEDEGGKLNIVYTWDEPRAFLTGKYTVTNDGESLSGMQIFGPNPEGGLRSWMFESNGTTSDGVWIREDDRWLHEGIAVLPDGTEVYSLNVLIPMGQDAFLWQTAEREINGEAVEGLPPVKVTRVKP